MRHALAPGGGDPSGFVLEDCSTQRNLDAVGRKQATDVGARLAAVFAEHGVPLRADIYSSQWCRCDETAELIATALTDAGFAPFEGAASSFRVTSEWGLNSFYQPQNGYTRAMCVARLNDHFFPSLDARSHVLAVTHYVTVSAVAGITVSSGGIVAYDTATGASTQLVDAYSLL